MFQAEGWSVTLSIVRMTVIGSEKSFDEVLEAVEEKMNSIDIQNKDLWE